MAKSDLHGPSVTSTYIEKSNIGENNEFKPTQGIDKVTYIDPVYGTCQRQTTTAINFDELNKMFKDNPYKEDYEKIQKVINKLK